ncbi:DUF3108 domain-containing protein [Roseateles koreensis]|uniref:DUF3108 domain-containing protein n=1 Tax=Roseateles koreensis TaxID=2987526 RepID=A0ABT5KPS2_9BURK|nr:DUF3108 domain-containing protein [Roseateles koreensis]MDC8784920.1 DUF3108 domain-containing protein [Roseateles koreensis]
MPIPLKPFKPAKPLAVALALSLLGHGLALLPPQIPRPRPSATLSSKGGAFALALQTRQLPSPPTAAIKALTTHAAAMATAPPTHNAPTLAPAPTEPIDYAAEARPANNTESTTPSAPSTITAPVAPDTQLRPGRPAPSGEWTYRLRSAEGEGTARLSWHQDNGRYALRLERDIAGHPLPAWVSQGELNEAGLVPQRYVQQRGGRDRAAINFRQAENLLSFSASSEVLPLAPGTQDRISWWLQLAALVEADPAYFTPGRAFSLRVAGLRGNALAWQFEVLDVEALPPDADNPDQPAIPVFIHVHRLPQGPYSGDVHLWLDPGRHHLPVVLRFEMPEQQHWSLQLIPSTPASAALH